MYIHIRHTERCSVVRKSRCLHKILISDTSQSGIKSVRV